MRTYIERPVLPEDGKLYRNMEKSCVEALIPNPFASAHAADLLELPNGDLLACWFAGSMEGNADISIALARLNAGESTWTAGKIISDDPTRSEQNPSLFLHPNGEIWLMYTAQAAWAPENRKEFNLQYTAEIRRKISRDNGYTWGETETVFSRPGSFCRQKIQILSSGRWVFGNWICAPDESRCGSDVTVIHISDDNGKNWRTVEVPESAGRVHANLIETEPGKLIALFRSRSADHIYIAHSEDNGDTWSVPQRTELPNNNASISAVKLKSGSIALAYNAVGFCDDPTRTVWPDQRCPITLAISEDNGKTWPFRRVLEMGEGFVGTHNDINNGRYEYPVLAEGADGCLHAAYTYRGRQCIKYVCVDEKWIRGEKTSPGAEDDPTMPCRR